MLMVLVEILMWALALVVVPITGMAVATIHEHMIERDAVPHREMEPMISGFVAAAVALAIYLIGLVYRIVEVLL